MATLTFAYVYEPITFQTGVREKSVNLNKFISSGIVARDPRLDLAADNFAGTGGRIGDIPFGTAYSSDEPNYSSDDNASFSTPLTAPEQSWMTWRLAGLNQSWSATDFVREMAADDPLDGITDVVAGYWALQMQRRLISTCYGIFNGYYTDMAYEVYSDVASPTAANCLSAEVLINAQRTMGDHSQALTAIAMHSHTYHYLLSLDLIDFIPQSQGKPFETFRGLRVIVDDWMPVIAGTNAYEYLTIAFGDGAFVWGSGRPLVPSEIARKADSGDGGGESILHSRVSEILHPWGFTFTNDTVSEDSPTLSDLEVAANWTRLFHRNNIPIAFIGHNNIPTETP